MPNIHAAIKDLRKNKKRAAKNKRMKSHFKRQIQICKEFIKAGNKAEALKALALVQQTLDKATKSHILSKNASSRKKSTLSKAIKSLK